MLTFSEIHIRRTSVEAHTDPLQLLQVVLQLTCDIDLPILRQITDGLQEMLVSGFQFFLPGPRDSPG